MANNRIYYAVHQVGLKEANTMTYAAGHGVQSVGITTNFNLEQVFEIGQLAIYENIEEIPDIEVTMSKVLDGYPLLYTLATRGSDTTAPTLAGRSNTKTFFALSVFLDTATSAAGTAPSMVECSGMYVSSVGYNFPLDDNFSEDVTLVGNDKIWKGDTRITETDAAARRDALTFDGAFGTLDSPQAGGGVNRRQDLLFGTSASGNDTNSQSRDPNLTILPPDVQGITSSGTNESSAGSYAAHVSNISVSADFGRESINELGRKAPYHRFVTFPIEVSTEIETTSISGDMVSATEAGILSAGVACDGTDNNLANRTIRIATCEGTRIYLGTKNKLSSVNYSGGDAGGGNVSVSYTFTTFNDFTVMHSGDVPAQSGHASGATWWAARGTNGYLNDVA